MKRTGTCLDLRKIAGHTFTAICHLGKWFPAKIDLATGNSTKLLFGFKNRDDAISYAVDNFDDPDVEITCSKCGGNNVLKDAYASWNVELQQWELSSVFDHTLCDDCESTSSPIETPIQHFDVGGKLMDMSHEEVEEKLRLVALPKDEQTEETEDRLAELLAIEDGHEPAEMKKEEITVTVQMTYSCDAADTIETQRDQIAVDLLKLAEGQGTASASCVEFEIKDVAPEAITYETADGETVSQYRSRRIASALAGLYLDGDQPIELLTNALCDLRHYAFHNGLYFAAADRSAQQFFQAERHAAKREEKP